MNAIAPTADTSDHAHGGGSLAAVATQMLGADVLKLRKKRSIMIWSLVIAIAPPVIFLLVGAIQHASNPAEHGPAGGVHNFSDGLRVIALLFGPLSALLIGVEAGAGDAAAGVFRDLVVTGRSRWALFASRVPAALAVCFAVIIPAYVVLLAGSFALASGLPTPSGSLILDGLGFLLLSTGMMCVVAVGFGSLTTSKPGAIIALVTWLIVASPLLAMIKSLGSSRDALLSQGVAHFSPVSTEGGGHGSTVTMSGGTALIVLVGWIVVLLALGTWRTRTMDA
ncbi:MAG TPA: hypothetical protein VIJ39_05530 [Solirubrobacteraceae bacterium]